MKRNMAKKRTKKCLSLTECPVDDGTVWSPRTRHVRVDVSGMRVIFLYSKHQDSLTADRVMQLSDSKQKLSSFVIMTLFPFYWNMKSDLILIECNLKRHLIKSVTVAAKFHIGQVG